MKKIVVTQNLDLFPDQIERLKALGELVLHDDLSKSASEWLRRCQGADIICTGKFGLKDKLYELKDVFVSLPFVAIDWIDCQKIKERNIIVSNAPGCNAAAVSEWVIGMMINLLRSLPQYIRVDNLPKHELPTREKGLEGKTVCVLGAGHVGARVATVCEALKMRVRVFRRGNDLKQAVQDADIVVDCLGANPTSYNLLDKKFFASLKKGSYFLTVTSPVIWDVDGLLVALENGIIAGVATDAASIQVGDTDDPLYKKLLQHPEILITPHIAYRTDVTARVANDMMIDNIGAWLKGKPINLV
jgi:phosphoglycerate dehydrogenase-like enzyme